MSVANPAPERRGVFVRTFPNVLTVLRIGFFAMFPFVFYFVWTDRSGVVHDLWPASVATVLLLTDLVDGKWARHFHVESDFGRKWDPRADKLAIYVLLGCAFFAIDIAVLRMVIAIAFGAFAMRDSMTNAARDDVATRKLGTMPAQRGGKRKMMVQSVAVIILLLPTTPWPAFIAPAKSVEVVPYVGATLLALAVWLSRTSGRQIIHDMAERVEKK